MDKWVNWPLWTLCPCTHQDNEHNAFFFLLPRSELIATARRENSGVLSEGYLSAQLTSARLSWPLKAPATAVSSWSCRKGSEKKKNRKAERRFSFSFFFEFYGHWQTCFHFIVWSPNWAASGDCRQSSALGEGADGGTSTALPEWRQPQRKAKSLSMQRQKVRRAARNQNKALPVRQE